MAHAPTPPRFQTRWQLMPIILTAYSCLVPREVALPLGSFDLKLYLIVMLLSVPAMVSTLRRRPLSFTAFDALAVFVTLWFIVSMSVSTSIAAGFTTGMNVAFTFGLSYAMGRIFIRSPHDLFTLLVAFLPGIVVAGFLMMLESVTHRAIVHPIFSVFPGAPPPFEAGEVRLGLMRASGPYVHPILAGLFHAALIPFAIFCFRSVKYRMMAWYAVLCMIFSVSSAGFLAFLINLIVSFVYILQKYVHKPLLRGLWFFSFLAVVFISLSSEGGLMSFVVRRLSLSSASGYYRILIWQYAGAEANTHPLFGIGTRDWIRPAWMQSGTVDSHWLLQAMRYGYPVSIGMAVLIIGAAIFVALRSNRWSLQRERDICMAIAFAMVSLVICGLTVLLWEGLLVWLIMMVGMAVSIGKSTNRAPVTLHGRAARPGAHGPQFPSLSKGQRA